MTLQSVKFCIVFVYLGIAFPKGCRYMRHLMRDICTRLQNENKIGMPPTYKQDCQFVQKENELAVFFLFAFLFSSVKHGICLF